MKSFENAEKTIDLALSRLGEKEISLLQCKLLGVVTFRTLTEHRSCLGLFR